MADALTAFRTLLGENDAMAYLVNMAPRLVELHRVLKPTGSLYLHCDPTMSHYLKVMLDAIFGPTNFRNEIIWFVPFRRDDPEQPFLRSMTRSSGTRREASLRVQCRLTASQDSDQRQVCHP